MLILQKGPSIASCIVTTTSVVNISPTMLANNGGCHKR
jgi:hypothetical protein